MSYKLSKENYDAVIFDLDGVITKTADVHARAWKAMFDEYLRGRSDLDDDAARPFEIASDYRVYVDGKPRYEGVRSFLKSRGIDIRYGDPGDPPEKETICGIGNRKNKLFVTVLARQGVGVFDSTVDLIGNLKREGIKVAVVSSSVNCPEVLDAAGIRHLFDAKVDGGDSAKLGLKGKPDPDIFLEAAKELGVKPGRSVVVEDAVAGVQAGRAGQFGCVIGVDRTGHAEDLKQGGADVVVSDLAEVAVVKTDADHPGEAKPGGKEGQGPNALRASAEAQGSDAMNLPSALEKMSEILRQCRGKRIVVFMDYDGTLTPIVQRPEDAVMSKDMRSTLKRLAKHHTIAIISGRDLDDVRSLVKLDGIYYAGSHGFDIFDPKGRHIEIDRAAGFLPELDRAENALREALDGFEGVQIERKRYSIAVHYRRAHEEDVEKVESIVERVKRGSRGLRRSSGKKVYELQPDVAWNKGEALLWLLEELGLGGSDVLPFYLGDDTTDEDAFAVLRERGIGIIVRDGPRNTLAHYALDNVGQVRSFLERMIPAKRGEGRI